MIRNYLIKTKKTKSQYLGGFALPTVLIASMIMLTVLLAAVTSTTATRLSFTTQYYNLLSKNAGEAGEAYAKACVGLNGGSASGLWTDAKPLTSSTNCAGESIEGLDCPDDAGCSVAVNGSGSIISDFKVGAPQVDSNGIVTSFSSIGSVKLLRSSTNSVWREYSNNSVYIAKSELPKPKLINPTATSVTATTATLGFTLDSTNGSDIISLGTCWGTSPQPTTNCSPLAIGSLTTLSPRLIGTEYSYSVAMSPDGKSLYAGNRSSSLFSLFSRDTSTGALTAMSPPTIATTTRTYAIAVSPDGKNFYAANGATSSGTIAMFSRDTDTGALTAMSPATIATGSYTKSLVVSPDGKNVYAHNTSSGTISMFSRNTDTGALTAMSPATIAASATGEDITISSDGKNIYLTNYSGNTILMFSRNTDTGALTAMSPATVASAYPFGIAISPDGKSAYAPNYVSARISMFSRDTDTGVLTAMTPAYIATGNNPSFIAISPDGKNVYVTIYASPYLIAMFSRDTTTGALTAMSPTTISTDRNPRGIIVSPDAKNVYAAGSWSPGGVAMFSRVNTFDPGVFTQERNGFTSGQQYYYRGYASNANGTGYVDGVFTTL